MHPFLKMINQVGDLIDRQITHTFPMSRVQDAWELQLTGNCGKVLLKPWEGV
jgi:L-iditol 2-dehydrogenase